MLQLVQALKQLQNTFNSSITTKLKYDELKFF